MKKPASKPTKPDWFDLNKYKDLTSFDAKGWVKLLHTRIYIYEGLFGPPTNDQEQLKINDDIFNSIKQDPLNSKHYSGYDDMFETYTAQVEGKIYSKLFLRNVKPLTMDQTFWLYSCFPEKAKRKLTKIRSRGYNPPFPNEYRNRPVDFDESSDKSSRINEDVHLWVNLNAPDNVIIEEFKIYLKEARKFLYDTKAGKLKSSKLKMLCDAKVLPYIDLKIWLQRENLTMTQYEIGSWLFPFDDEEVVGDPAEKIRKTTEPYVEEILDFGYLEAMSKIPE